MVNVIAWPDLPVVGWEFTTNYPVSRSRGLSGREYLSSAQAPRRAGALTVNGVHSGLDAGGTIEMLKAELAGVHLVRIETIPAHWHLAHQTVRGAVDLKWTAGGVPLNWRAGGVDLRWAVGGKLVGTPFDDAGWQGLSVEGFEPGAVAAFPNELVRIGGESARVYRKAIADEEGVALLRVNAPISVAGPVIIGSPESVVYRLDDFPRSMRSVGSQFSFDFSFVEVFEAETDGFMELDPWR